MVIGNYRLSVTELYGNGKLSRVIRVAAPDERRRYLHLLSGSDSALRKGKAYLGVSLMDHEQSDI